ncbi:MAG: DNA/RNA nuclease SfsA [Candidatus Helarchaeales archaeon]
MKIPGKFEEATFISRQNRYLGIVLIDGIEEKCFIPNPGRMTELLKPNVKVFVRKVSKKNRKTSLDLLGVKHGNTLVSIDSSLPNKLIQYSISNHLIPEISHAEIRPEFTFGNSRIDFLLRDGNKKCLLEVKSCTLVVDGQARFPDAPTKRGRRHVQELIKAGNLGYEAMIFFCIQREDANDFAPNDETDPEFGTALREAAKNGVEILAYTCKYSVKEIELDKKVPVLL